MVDKTWSSDGKKVIYMDYLYVKGDLKDMTDEEIGCIKDILRVQIEMALLQDGIEFSEEKLEWVILQNNFYNEYKAVTSESHEGAIPYVSIACKTKILSVVKNDG